MSHFTTIQSQIRQLEALRDACGELGLGLTANAKCRGYAGITRLAPHVIQLEGAYDIAVDSAPEKDRSYVWPDDSCRHTAEEDKGKQEGRRLTIGESI